MHIIYNKPFIAGIRIGFVNVEALDCIITYRKMRNYGTTAHVACFGIYFCVYYIYASDLCT